MSKKEGKKNSTVSDLLRESNLTYDDYVSIEDGNRYELVNGKLELMSLRPSVIHQMISCELQKAISKSCESDYIILHAPLDVILSSNEVRQPDLILVHRKRLNIVSNRGIVGAPDLVVEIVSPSTMKRDKIDKLKTYEKYHISEYWIVEPKNGALEQYILQDGKYDLVNIFLEDDQITSPNIPCTSFSMSEIMSLK